jgi:two-component system, cell cycle response regulator
MLEKDPNFGKRKSAGRTVISKRPGSEKSVQDTLQRRAAELAALHATLLDISAPYELPVLLEKILERAVHLLNAHKGSLFLADHGRREVRCAAVYGFSGQAAEMALKFGQGAAGKVAESGQPLIIQDYPDWPGKIQDPAELRQIKALISVPMLWQGQVSGVINVAETGLVRAFSPADIELLSMFANQSAILVENARLLQAEHQQREAAETLREVASVLNACLDRSEVLKLILEQLARVVHYDSASVMLIIGQKLQIVAAKGFDLEERKSLAIESLKHLQEVINSRKYQIIPDTLLDPRWIELDQRSTIRCWMGVPLVFQDRIIGVLNLDKDQPGFYSGNEAELTAAYANQAAIAIENARMYEAEHRRAQLIETLLRISETIGSTLDANQIFEEIVNAARVLLPVDRVVIFLWDEEKGRLYPTLPPPGSPLQIDLAEKQIEHFSQISFSPAELPLLRLLQVNNTPIAITDAYASDLTPRKWVRYFGSRSVLVAPFFIQDQFSGALYMDCATSMHSFTPSEIDLASALARQTALAIERASLFEAAQQRARGAETLRQATAAVTGTLRQEEAIKRILEQLAYVVPYDSASVQLLQDGYLEIVGGRGWPDPQAILGMHFPIPGDNPNTNVILERKPHIVNDTATCYKTFNETSHRRIRSWLGVPLIVQERVIGMVSIDSYTEDYFTPEHLRFASAFADQVAIAIENTRLYDEVEQRVNELSCLYLAAQDLAASLEPKVVLEKIAHHITAAIDGTSGYIREIDDEGRAFGVLAVYVTAAASPLERERANMQVVRLFNYPEAVCSLHKGEAISFGLDAQYLSQADRQALQDMGIQACLVVPIVYQGRLLGEVEVWETRRPRTFTQAEKSMVQALAQHAAGTIENARLYTVERQRVKELDALRATIADITSELELPNLLRDILERAVTLMNATGGDLGIFNEADRNLLIVTSFNLDRDYTGTCLELGEGLMGRVALTLEPLIVSDYQNWAGKSDQYGEGPWKAAIVVPLQMGAKLLGAIGVVDVEPQRQFTPSDQRLLTMFAQQASIAINNARMYLATKEAADRRAILHQASQAIVAASLDPEGIYFAIHNAAAQLMPSEAFVIALMNEADNVIEAVYLMDRAGRTPPITLPAGSGLSGHIINTGKSVYIEDIEEFDEVESIRFGDRQDVRSILATPMILRGKVIGMLSVQSYQARAYTPEDMYLLEMLSAHAAIAIDNTRLFQEVQLLAITDPLTGANNRRELYELGEREFARSKRYKHTISAMMVDIDKFKKVNDTYGHTIGDQILIQLTERIRANIRDIDILGRYGGDEFAILLPETGLEAARQVAERLRSAISETPFETEAGLINVTASIGVSTFSGKMRNLETLIDNADVAVYIAKEAGRNRVGVA